MRRPELVPLPAPAEGEVAGDVREIGDGAVGVTAPVRGLAASVGLDALADLAFRVGRAARLEVALLGHVAVGHLPVHDPLAADHPREADVDHAARRLDVQPDAEAGEKDGRPCQQPHRPGGAGRARSTVAPGDPHAAAEQIEERRIRERRAPEDLALVEEAQRHREGEQRKQVEVAQREHPAQVRETEQEESAEREPDPGIVDRLTAEGARAATRHRPRDLWPRPRLHDCARAVVDLAEHDLARLARPRLHHPLVGRRPIVGVRLWVRRVPGEPVAHLAVPEEHVDRLLLGEPGRSGGRDERRLDESPVLVVDRLADGRGGRRRSGGGAGRSGERERRQRRR